MEPIERLDEFRAIISRAGKARSISIESYSTCKQIIEELREANIVPHAEFPIEVLSEHLDILMDRARDTHSFSLRIVFINKHLNVIRRKMPPKI